MEILVKFLGYVNYIIFWKNNFPQNVTKSINHRIVECRCVVSWEFVILKIQNVKWKVSLVDCLYNDAKGH